MGAWGVGSFQNDSVMDWVWELTDRSVVRRTLETVANWDADEYLEVDESSNAVGAAEAVAALIGRPGPELPPEAAEWVTGQPPGAGEGLVDLAVQALARLESNSELQILWDEAEGGPEWHAAIQDLSRRLLG